MRTSALLTPSLLTVVALGALHAAEEFRPVEPPPWVADVTRMAFVTWDQIEPAAKAGVQVVQTNLVWPYYPLRRDGGGLDVQDSKKLRELVAACHGRGMRLVLGLPPFPPVELVKAHPDWRVHPDPTGSVRNLEPRADDLGTRLGCNQGPWGDYLIDLLVELMVDYDLDGYSFDGNDHPPICYCPACKAAYRADRGNDLPGRVDLDDLAYREYLVWRGERLEDHYRRMQQRLKAKRPDAVVMSWTVNAGRYGHLLSTPRSMTTRMNLLFDLPMQEWWLDETNLGASVVPSFGAAYLAGIMGGRPAGSEPYLMSRGNPYGTESFPPWEQRLRTLLAITHGTRPPLSFGWPGLGPATAAAFQAIADRAPWMRRTRPLAWAGLLVSEQTRQFAAYRDLPGTLLPHLFGAFRAGLEEHRPMTLINDWDLTPERLAPFKVIVLPGSAALSDSQLEALERYVEAGGGLVALGPVGLTDELGRPRAEFPLASLVGADFELTPGAASLFPAPDTARLTWTEHEITADRRLDELVPSHQVVFKGPITRVRARDEQEVFARLSTEGQAPARPALLARRHGSGRVVYAAAALDAALWSYSFPYQRRLLISCLDWAAGGQPSIRIEAPMAVETTFFEQEEEGGRRIVIHFFNAVDTAGHHGQPGQDVPLREEAVPIAGIRVRWRGTAPVRFHVEPGRLDPVVRREPGETIVELPPLDDHRMLVGEWP